MRLLNFKILFALISLFVITIVGCIQKFSEEKNNSSSTNVQQNDQQRNDSLLGAIHLKQFDSGAVESSQTNSRPNRKPTQEENINFLGDSVLPGKYDLVRFYIRKYLACDFWPHERTELRDFSKMEGVGDINGDHRPDTVFVLLPFDMCDEGCSYYFLDKNIPRLKTDSYCANASNLFSVADIDEDGTREIGIYYSSCASRFKSLRLYSLKKGEWKKIGTSEFDIFTQDPSAVVFQHLIKKTGKNRFKMCNFYEDKKYWEQHYMK